MAEGNRKSEDVSNVFGFLLLYNRLNKPELFFVYILYSVKFDKYYIGQTQHLAIRFENHDTGKVKSTKPYLPWELARIIEKSTRSEAMRLEKKL